MINDDDFDFLTDFCEQEQNDFLRTYLTETTKYLRAIPFSSSSGYFYYENIFVDDEYHGNSIVNLAALLYLLVTRDVIWPIRLKFANPKHPVLGELPYFGFTRDFKFLNQADDDFFELIQEGEFQNMAKVMED